MNKCSIICICQIYNELDKGNLERFVKYIKPLVDALVVYDDSSTDGSYEYMLKQTPYVIRGVKNDFVNEINHKHLLLAEALKLSPDFILWLDADEVLTANATRIRLEELCNYCLDHDLDGLSLHELNLWRSHSWRRLDSLYDEGWFTRLWRVKPNLDFGDPASGLHVRVVPPAIKNVDKVLDIAVIHYGFSSKKQLAYKYLVYKSHGQRGYDMLDRLISEEKLVTEQIPKELFPDGLWVNDDQPKVLSFIESLTYVEKYREEIFRPKFSVICLIYKSVEWLKFVYEQVLKYTDMADKEFFFIANDANDSVLSYLKENYIPHYVLENTPQEKEEWYINNVYRAYNFSAKKAKGDFLIFINSDMAFTPNWVENLWKSYNGFNCIASRLVESGKLRSGLYGIEKNFGKNYDSYNEEKFQQYAVSVALPKIEDGGLFMPLMIRKQHFEMVGGYPEGNIVLGSDIFRPIIAKKGESNISGDNVLMNKLRTMGVNHQTAFDSIIYHFQCGELDSLDINEKQSEKTRVAVCNDIVTGSMGEKVLWDFLLEFQPASVGIDISVVGKNGSYARKARNYISTTYPNIQVIIQNATFIGAVDENLYTIAFLQDDLRAMGRISKEQEQNLRIARKLVTNSITTAISYPEYDFELIPVGVDSDLFKPMNKTEVRTELGFMHEQIGIFVGNFSEVKGWSKVRECIEHFPEIKWILVSKYSESFNSPNVHVYNRIPQSLLAKLLNCADFFIIGSPVETQCLAAIEACLCDIPVVMRNVGIFKEFTEEERSKVGIFGEDFISAIQEISNKPFSPRQVILDKKLTVHDSMKKWNVLLTSVFQELMIESIKPSNTFKPKKISKFLFGFEYLWRYRFLKKMLGINWLGTYPIIHAIKNRAPAVKKRVPSPIYSLLVITWNFCHKILHSITK